MKRTRTVCCCCRALRKLFPPIVTGAQSPANGVYMHVYKPYGLHALFGVGVCVGGGGGGVGILHLCVGCRSAAPAKTLSSRAAAGTAPSLMNSIMRFGSAHGHDTIVLQSEGCKLNACNGKACVIHCCMRCWCCRCDHLLDWGELGFSWLQGKLPWGQQQQHP